VQICSKCQAQIPDTSDYCQNCFANLSEWSENRVSLRKMQENPRVSYVRLMVSDDACPVCQQMEGSFSKDTPPILPIPGCSHTLGCRCSYQPILEEIFP
jgi:RNA polymerase subunit RPABC4/transcription elongation factor Spt4